MENKKMQENNHLEWHNADVININTQTTEKYLSNQFKLNCN